MISYLFQTTLCTAFSIAFYLLLLEKEKMHRFNRAYLVFSLLFSYTIPLINITITQKIDPAVASVLMVQEYVEMITIPAVITAPETARSQWVLPAIYLVPACLMMFRFARNIRRILRQARKFPGARYQEAVLVTVPGLTAPFSFLRFIFLNKEDYERGNTREEVMAHELTHVKQRHSLDIFFIELLMIVAWFNPFLYLYRKAIRLNHEFLADEEVTRRFDKTNYQYLLLDYAAGNIQPSPASSFNYSITKKRIVMLTKPGNHKTRHLKKAAAFMILPFLVLGFSEINFLSDPAGQVNAIATSDDSTKPCPVYAPQFSPGQTEAGVSAELMAEYQAIVQKHRSPGPTWWLTFRKSLSQIEHNRLLEIYKQMNHQQQGSVEVLFVMPAPPMKSGSPTQAQLDSWRNGKVYGIWIDNKRVKNTNLAKYRNTDFANVFVSKLAKNAVNYGNHYYQVNLMTTGKYKTYYEESLKQQGKPMMVFRAKQKAV